MIWADGVIALKAWRFEIVGWEAVCCFEEMEDGCDGTCLGRDFDWDIEVGAVALSFSFL